MEQEQISKIENELSELNSRANNIGYKNKIPSLPKNLKNKEVGLQISVMAGFRKRLSNWKQGLYIMENPGGFPSNKKKETTMEDSFIEIPKESITALSEHFSR